MKKLRGITRATAGVVIIIGSLNTEYDAWVNASLRFIQTMIGNSSEKSYDTC